MKKSQTQPIRHIFNALVISLLLFGAIPQTTITGITELTDLPGADSQGLANLADLWSPAATAWAANRGEGLFAASMPPLIWSEEQKLVPFDPASNDKYGIAVAVSGDTAVIGSFQDDDNGNGSGSVYIYLRSGATWTLEQKIVSSDGDSTDRFGNAVAIDGDTAVIGAYRQDPSGETGAAYVFTRSGSTWSEQQKLTASDAATGDQFGWAVAVSGDTAIIGADGENSGAGAAYVFTRSGSTWSEEQKLTASDGGGGDAFGLSVSVDGDTAIVGANGHNASAGAAYVFTRTGSTWTEQQKLTASDGAGNDLFGQSVSVSGDSALVGASGDESSQGSAYIFTRSGSTWSEQQKLTASDGAGGDEMGFAAALAGDTALVGAIGDETRAGAAYVFTRSGSTWSEQDKLTASDTTADDEFGYAVSISGATSIAGAFQNDTGASNAGAAYVFTAPSNDTDGDTILDDTDIDDDNDGIPDSEEDANAFNGGDSDNDGINDSLDLDSDNDGIPDLWESGLPIWTAYALDADGDGRIDTPTNLVGGNGLADDVETSIDSDSISYTIANTDGNPNPDYIDLDSDNDGINDVLEGDTPDADGDGQADGTVGSNGIASSADTSRLLPDVDCDDIPDFRELDSDDDGLFDLVESGDLTVIDGNNDGMVDGADGSDSDGILPSADTNDAIWGEQGNLPPITGDVADFDATNLIFGMSFDAWNRGAEIPCHENCVDAVRYLTYYGPGGNQAISNISSTTTDRRAIPGTTDPVQYNTFTVITTPSVPTDSSICIPPASGSPLDNANAARCYMDFSQNGDPYSAASGADQNGISLIVELLADQPTNIQGFYFEASELSSVAAIIGSQAKYQLHVYEWDGGEVSDPASVNLLYSSAVLDADPTKDLQKYYVPFNTIDTSAWVGKKVIFQVIPWTEGGGGTGMFRFDDLGIMGFCTPTVNLGNLVWEDSNENGLVDGGENGIANVDVEVFRDNGDGTLNLAANDFLVGTATTDASGNWAVANLQPGDYFVRIVPSNFAVGGPLAAYRPTPGTATTGNSDIDNQDHGHRKVGYPQAGVRSSLVTLTSGGEPDSGVDGDGVDGNLTIDFGFSLAAISSVPTLSLGNQVWNDLDNNGLLDGAETGIANVQVDLYGGRCLSDNSYLGSTATDGSGIYLFQGLDAGEYTVVVPGSNFYLNEPLAGLVSSLEPTDGPDPDDDTNDDDNGAVSELFVDAVASQPISLTLGTEPTNDGDADNNSNLSVDFGFNAVANPALGNIGNLVWTDTNGNGLFDSGTESGIANVALTLWLDDGDGLTNPSDDTAIRQTTTDGSGLYGFANLPAGTYYIQIDPANFAASGPLNGLFSTLDGQIADNDIDNDDNGGDNPLPHAVGLFSTPVSLILGSEPDSAVDGDGTNGNLTVDFGFYTPPSNMRIGNLVWRDLDDNAIYDSGSEVGIDGVALTLFNDSNGNGIYDDGTDAQAGTTSTSGGGLYLFDNLAPGFYFVRVDAANWQGSGPLDGLVSSTTYVMPDFDINNYDKGLDDLSLNDMAIDGLVSGLITLLPGTEPDTADDGDDTNGNLTIDWGFFQPLALGNFIWTEEDDNGIFDPGKGETPAPGVTLSLIQDDGDGVYEPITDTVAALQTTDSNGNYQFNFLIDGDYFVVLAPTNFDDPNSPYNNLQSSSGANSEDPAIDNSDHGTPLADGSIASGLVTLALNSEPTTDGDNNPNTQFTIDMGLFSATPQIEIGKWLNTTPTVTVGSSISFTIRITNTGSITITNLPLTDTFDGTYLTFNTVEDALGPNPATTINANSILWADVTDFDVDNDGQLAPNEVLNIIVFFDTMLETTGAAGGGPACNEAAGYTYNQASAMGMSACEEIPIAPPEPKLTLGDVIWHDIDNDGTQDPSEPGINGVMVNLYEVTGSGNIFITTTTTSISNTIDGFYQFNVASGKDYLVEVASTNFDPGGPLANFVLGQNQPNITNDVDPDRTAINVMVNDDTLDFGFYCEFDLALVKTLAAGQPSVIAPGDNVTFTLTIYNQGLVTATNVTVADYVPTDFTVVGGGWSGSGGSGTVTQTLAASLTPSATANSSTTVDIVLTAGATLSGTYTNTAEIITYTTSIVDSNGNSLPDVDSTPDDTNGNSAGETADLVDDEVAEDGKNGGDEDDHDPATITVVPSQPTVSIGNQVWEDGNDNGLYDVGEDVIPNLVMELWQDVDGDGVAEPLGDDGLTAILTTTTNASGQYSFTQLLPGDYFVRIPAPPPVTPLSSIPLSEPDNGVDDDDNGDQPDGPNTQILSPVVNLTVGEEPGTSGGGSYDYTVDFGLVDPFIGNLVWHDENNNGLVDPLEPGIGGVTITVLYDANASGTITGSELVPFRTTQTDSSGLYVFPDLIPNSNYQVVIPIENFQPGGALENLPYSSDTTATSDNQIDEDDNGIQSSMGMTVTSPLIRIDVDGEPIDGSSTNDESGRGSELDNGDDNNGDMTIDFGFYQLQPLPTLAVDKQFNGVGDYRVGETISFTIHITNTGNVTITTLPLEDRYSQAFMTYVSANPAPDNTPNSGILTWSNLLASLNDTDGLGVGEGVSVVVTFTTEADTTQLPVMSPCTQTGHAPNLARSVGAMAGTTPVVEDADDVSCDSVQILNPTSVQMVNHSITSVPEGVLVRWSTASESDIMGFHIWRSSGVDAELRSGEMVIATNAGQPVGANYQWMDAGATLQSRELYLLEIIKSDGSTERTVIVGFASMQFLSLGNRVWLDDGVGNGLENNGVMDGQERGIAGVIVNLLDANGGAVRDANGQPLTTTTTIDGYYLFDNLLPGEYMVQIDPSNFQAGSILSELVSSSPTEEDPNANGDSNDNGLDSSWPSSNGVRSGVIQLSYNEEVLHEPDPGGGSGNATDANSNLTVDFGFIYVWDDGWWDDLLLNSYSATRQADSVLIQWETPTEINTYGFHLYRSTICRPNDANCNPEDRVRITERYILGQGPNGGHYTFRDDTVQPGIAYIYYLEETEITGKVNQVDSVAIENEANIFLPFVAR
ncbi:MAG: SdrD B-like domain-containing protein [Chloroflexota bacterium]